MTAVVAVNAVPVAYVVAAVGLAARAEPALERAARAAGAGAMTVLRTITLPLMRPALATAAVLVFVLTLGTFAIPLVLGSPAGFATVTTRIYANLARSSDPAAFVEAILLALLLVVVAVAVVAPADLLLGTRLRVTRTSTTDPGPAQSAGNGSGRWVTAAVAGYLLVAVGVPLVALVSTALTTAVGLPPVPGNWTLRHFDAVLTVRNSEALSRSLLLALAAASILLVLGGLRGRPGTLPLRPDHRDAGDAHLRAAGSTLAVGLLITYGRWLGDTLADHPAGLPRQALGVRTPAGVRSAGPAAPGRARGRPGRAAPPCSAGSGPSCSARWRRHCWPPGWSAS